MGDVDVAATAALIGEPARAAVLLALMEGEALPASELASRAGIAPSTASVHLAKLRTGGLVSAERRGRQRYFQIADPAVAAALEALSVIAPARPVRSLREASASHAIRDARTCYDHLAGRLGVELAAALERSGVLVYGATNYLLGPDAEQLLNGFGIDVAKLARLRRPLVRPCLDWSERRRHVAGALGAALADRLFELDWLRRRQRNRSVEITAAGRTLLAAEFGIEMPPVGRG
ncbi:MAG TPA: metalloregulator ArsR/SmtB family transcription factor [Gaiellaceae bacterium]|nr:metalloregulator ArsR/SmtB family transcription factor [Gaiellaceae bacterium]